MADTTRRKVLTVVMDGVGLADDAFGNALLAARTPRLRELQRRGIYQTLRAHGKAVGMPSDSDLGNSEVGHNAIGAGHIYSQGAKLVQEAVASGEIFRGETWQQIVSSLREGDGRLHLIGLLSDGNVHSHQEHLHALIVAAKRDGIAEVFLHVLLDGRDVGERTADCYAEKLEEFCASLRSEAFSVQVASGGGRMRVTMDRYGSDWKMVEIGWNAHVHGQADHHFSGLSQAVSSFYEDPNLTDQYLPAFVIEKDGEPVGPIRDRDAVVLFNFRGDRAMEISRAFTEEIFEEFDRGIRPDVFFAGMMQYDGDLKIPEHFLVEPPKIKNTMGEFLAAQGKHQFACSETQKFGHVTYFWNGNCSGKFDDKLETYIEIPSDRIDFDLKPWMKAHEITEATIEQLHSDDFDYGRINYANGDMVGHTGNFDAAVSAVATVDLMIGRLMVACEKLGVILMVTADHGNCEEMFQPTKDSLLHSQWKELDVDKLPEPKTSHTLNPVPFYVFDPLNAGSWQLRSVEKPGLGNIANTVLTLLGIDEQSSFMPSLIESKR